MARRSHSEALAKLIERYGLPAGAAEPLQTLLGLLEQPAAPTSVHDPGEGVRVHIADSLSGLGIEELRTAGVIADLGAGAGLPGLVLAAALPRAHVTLVESVGRKCAFLAEAADAMRLGNTDVVCARAEEWRGGAGRCDVVCARALAALPVLCEYAAPLLRPDGVLVAWKGAIDDQESADAAAASRHLGLTIEGVRDVVPFAGSLHRTLVVARKTAPTPPGFPRRPGMANKRPLTAKSLR